MSELVKTEQVISVASLNNLSYNLAAFIGPCLGGMIYLRLGPAPLYLFNALSFCGLLYLYFRWQRQVPKEIRANLLPPCNRIQSADRAFATALRNERFRCLLVYSLVIFCLSNTFAALLPSLVGDIATATGVADPNQYGIRMGALGIGAIFAALVLPKLRAICAERVLLSMALCVFGLMLVCLAITSGLIQHVCLIISGGVAWSAIVTSLNSAALRSFPAYMRARSLSLYILVTAAGQASGGLIWGALAHQLGVTVMMIAAGLAMLSCAVLVFNARDFLEQA